MKNTIQKSALSTNLIAFVFVLFGAQLHAQDEANLINVTSLAQLNAIRYDLDGNGTVDNGANAATYKTAFPLASDAGVLSPPSGVTFAGYELMNDLDFKNGSTNTVNFSIWAEGSTATGKIDAGWKPIGDNSSKFTAIFEGNGHTISNLFINRSSTTFVGLFGYVKGSNAELRNLGMVEVKVTGDDHVGGLVGYNELSTVSNSYATGAVTGSDRCRRFGGSQSNGSISGSYATGSVTGVTAGGLVGNNIFGPISNSYATGAVTGRSIVGGLVGFNGGNISGSYATGAVTVSTDRVGGLVGNNGGNISGSYATGAVTVGTDRVGGLVGSNSATITANYYNSQTTGQSDDTGKGEPKTTAELVAPTGYTGIYETWDDGPDATSYDDTDYWDFGTNLQYPVLKIDVNGDGSVGDLADLRAQRHPRLSVGSFSLDFVEVNTASPGRMTYDLTGTNLTGVVTLVIEGTDASLFSVDMTTISPAGEEISGTTVTVTFRPTTAGDPFTAMITHSGGGLTPVVVNLTGSAVSPTLTSTQSNSRF